MSIGKIKRLGVLMNPSPAALIVCTIIPPPRYLQVVPIPTEAVTATTPIILTHISLREGP